MATDLDIGTAAQGDLSELLELYRQLHPRDPHLSIESASEILQRFAGYRGSAIFIGRVGGKLITTCAIIVVPNLTRGGLPYAVIENVVTDEHHRQQGFGHLLLQAAVTHAWTFDCYKVMLMSGSKNPGTLRFYNQAGFEQSKTGFQIRRPET
ncbi:GNAT family N-acetyltransferase [Phyllobacterium myrsinacearum]|uniref:GNAT superfamily N-acetyltransferase n=1 Tax=Phyllobacterium myrsinacearum TaxID=28101 RepID=A0A839EFT3_9HYPH|nr:GNAT family N-acetyltransferase [Phyllobacterium myrsinacearum]MBA8876464.1 GNAT superfamily N-acetyltransferase [Phyllobacterium myrsinacearum]